MSDKFIPGTLVPAMQEVYNNTPEDRFRILMESLNETRFQNLSPNNGTTFKAVCISGFRYNSNSGTGITPYDATLNADGHLEIVILPIYDTEEQAEGLSGILPDIRKVNNVEDFIRFFNLYKSSFVALSEFRGKMINSPQFGQRLTCYLTKTSLSRANLRDIRFVQPTNPLDVDQDVIKLASLEGIETIPKIFQNNISSLMGQYSGINMEDVETIDKQSPEQALFEARLKEALTQRGMLFYVTDRSRTPEDQVQRIKNKYYGNGKQEVISTYGTNTGAALVAAIEAGDEVTLLKLASKTSRHLKGSAIDIRSYHYTNEEMGVVLAIIRELGGNPLVEPIATKCWERSGRNVEIAKRLASPGGSKGKPCYNEHIHIDIPNDYT